MSLMSVKLASIKVRDGHNPRTYFDAEEMQALVESVRAVGIAQPILLRPRGARVTSRKRRRPSAGRSPSSRAGSR